MNKRILLVGGSSFIATNLIEKFINESYQVVVYGRNKPQVESHNLTYINGELSDIETKLSQLSTLNITDAIYLVNNIPVNADIEDYNERIILNKAAIAFLFTLVKRVVYFSSGGRIYKSSLLPHKEIDELSPNCLYGKSKVELEAYVAEYSALINRDYLIIRPSNPYGKHQCLFSNQGLIAILIGKIRSGRSIEVWGTGQEIRDYIYIDDFANVFFKLFEISNPPYKIFNIGSGQGVSTLHIIETVLELTGCTSAKQEFIDIHRSLIPSNILCIDRLNEVIGPYHLTPLSIGISAFIDSLGTNK